MMRTLFLVFLLALPGLGAELPTLTFRPLSLPAESTNRVLLVKPKASSRPADIERLRNTLKLADTSRPTRLKWKHFTVPPGRAKQDAIELLKHSGLFEHVTEPQVYTTQETIPNDPSFSQLWGMTNIAATLAWDRIKAAPDVVVAVVDTGIDFSHPDLAANLWTGPSGEHGYSFLNNAVTPGGMDDHGHGTHCAGTIAAVGNNSIGVAGLAWKAKLMAIKVLHHGSGNSIDVVNGLIKIVELKESGIPVLVSNHSYGADGTDAYMEDGFRLLAEADVFAAVAAGNVNKNIDIKGFYPAAYPFNNIVSTVASDQFGKKASFSNYGLVNSDIAAPGVSILSTITNGYDSWSGTSMAAPHVCGLALLLRSLNPSLTANQTREVILHPESYDSLSFLNNTSARINAAKTLNNPKVFENPFRTNRPPIISASPYILISNSQPVTIFANGSDPDGDPLRWNSTSSGTPAFIQRLLAIGGFTLVSSNNTTTISSSPLAYQLSSSTSIAVSDSRGGGAFAASGFEVARRTSLQKPILVKTWKARTNETPGFFAWTFDVDDPAKSNYLYSVIWTFPNYAIGASWQGTVPSTNEMTASFSIPTARCSARVFVMDKWLNHLATDTLVFPPNSTTHPKLVVNLSTNQGNIPFDVRYDMTASQRVNYWSILDAFTGQSIFDFDSIQTNTFDIPGTQLKQVMGVNEATGETDIKIVPIFASRFLDSPVPKTEIVTMNLQEAGAANGPWTDLAAGSVTVTNTGPSRFYRSRVQIGATAKVVKYPPLPK